jgi:hypothetical protein
MSEVKRPPRIDGTGSHYACVPRIIAEDARQHDLKADECLIVSVIIAAAMVAAREHKFARAMAAGRKTIDGVIAIDEEFDNEWKIKNRAKKVGTFYPAPQRAFAKRGDYSDIRLTHKRGNLNKLTAKAGRDGFKDGMKRARARTLGEHVQFRITRRALLCRAHLGTSGQHFTRLEQILDRLEEEINVAGVEGPPLIEIADRSRDHLVVTVFTHWLAQPFVRVPLPWPMRSAPAVFLRLILQCLPTGSVERGHSHIIELGERVGVFAPLKAARRSLTRAIDAINAAIAQASIETDTECRKAKVKTPLAFKVEFFGKNRVQVSTWSRRIRALDKFKPVRAVVLDHTPDAEGESDYDEMRKQLERDANSRTREFRRNRAHRAAVLADNE